MPDSTGFKWVYSEEILVDQALLPIMQHKCVQGLLHSISHRIHRMLLALPRRLKMRVSAEEPKLCDSETCPGYIPVE